MDPPYYLPQPINAHTDRADASERHPRYSVPRSVPEPSGPSSSAWASTSQSLGMGNPSPLSTSSTPQSYYTANTSPMSYLTTSSTSTPSSNISFPYSVTSIGSYKSRKNVLYPRRVHPSPLPVAVSSGHSASVSHDVRLLSSFSLLVLSLNRDTPALHVGPHLASPVPLYNLVAVRRDPSIACGKSAPPVVGAPWRPFATCARSD